MRAPLLQHWYRRALQRGASGRSSSLINCLMRQAGASLGGTPVQDNCTLLKTIDNGAATMPHRTALSRWAVHRLCSHVQGRPNYLTLCWVIACHHRFCPRQGETSRVSVAPNRFVGKAPCKPRVWHVCMYVRVHAPDPVVWKDPGGFSRSLGFSLAKPLVSHESHQYSSSASFRY